MNSTGSIPTTSDVASDTPGGPAMTDAHVLHVTFFPNRAAQTLKAEEMTLGELRDLVVKTTASEKDKLPFFKLAKFGDARSDKNSLRHDKNVIGISGVELDYDDKKMSFDAAIAIAKDAGVYSMLYTSSSYTAIKPKWRIVCPTSRELPPGGRKKLVERINGLYGGIFAGESFTLSQAFYFGKVNDNPEHQCVIVEGAFIDLRDDLDNGALGKSGKSKDNDDGGYVKDEKYVEDIRSGAAYHPSLLALAARRVGGGMNAEEVAKTLRELLEQSTGPRDKRWHAAVESIPQIVSSAAKKYIPEGVVSDPDVARLNETYALVIVGDKTAIMKTTPEGVKFLALSAFEQWLANRHTYYTDKNGGTKSVPLARHWMTHPQRRQYEGITFSPNREVPNHFNLWRGFAVERRPGDCSKFLAHLKDNVCRGDEAHYKWVVGWFAQIVQHPDKKVGTSLVIRGKQGTGKTMIGWVFAKIFGDHYALVAEPRFITGRFNSHLTSCLLLHCDEAFWAGDHEAEGKLKDLITGESQFIEFKGKEPIRVANYVRLLVTGNQNWMVPAGFEERRFATLDIGEDHIQDKAYFAAIIDETANGGSAALLDHLLNFDLTSVDLKTIPTTAALLDQKFSSLSPENGWWLDTLMRGELPSGHGSGPGKCSRSKLFDRYNRHASKQGARRRSIETKIGMFLSKIVPGLKKDEDTIHKQRGIYDPPGPPEEKVLIYSFPPLAECRASFSKKLNQDVDWAARDGWSTESEEPM